MKNESVCKTAYKDVRKDSDHAKDTYSVACIGTVKNEDYHAFHEIFRTVLTEKSDEDYYRDFFDNYFPDGTHKRARLLLKFNGYAIGTAAIDKVTDNAAVMRMVAVRDGWRNKGHGQALAKFFLDHAQANGIKTLCLNAVPASVSYYQRLGFQEECWDKDVLKIVQPPDRTQMVKHLD